MTTNLEESASTKAVAVAAVIVVGAAVLLGVDYSQTRDRASTNQISIAEMRIELKNLSGALSESTEATRDLIDVIKSTAK